MTRFGLTSRLLLVILAVQLALFAALAVVRVNGLRGEIAAESRLAAQTARSLVLATVGTMQGAVPPDRVMALLPDRLVPPRHTRIGVLDPRDGTVRQPVAPPETYDPAPAWFAALVAPAPLETRLPVSLQGRLRGFVYIGTDPGAEIAAAWRSLRAMLGLAAFAAVAQTALIWLATRRALRPVALIAARLGDLRRGDLSARVGPIAQPDLSPVADGVDELAAALQQAQAQTAHLQRQVIGRADAERKSIARDLHDEMGPCLFGLRVEADALHEAAPSQAIRDHAIAISTIAEEIARVNRALLDDLRPVAIGQLPLAGVLTDYVEDLQRRFGHVRFELDLMPGLPEPDEATALTLFRILQEGTTNALRHSGARGVTIRLWTDPADWRMILADDGQGMAADHREGTGLTGMRERITALGGSLGLSSTPNGTTLDARLPRWQGAEGQPA
ncbi:histidine kinase [Paracoccus homiensis]|nr:histidine kinase [Paracoccus homiensis]